MDLHLVGLSLHTQMMSLSLHLAKIGSRVVSRDMKWWQKQRLTSIGQSGTSLSLQVPKS